MSRAPIHPGDILKGGLDEIGRMAAADPAASTNPAPFSAAQYAEIGIQAVHGRLCPLSIEEGTI